MPTLELESKPSFLVLTFRPDKNRFQVTVSPDLPPIISCWQASTRLSPILGLKSYPLAESHAACFEGEAESFLILLGPMHPLKLAECALEGDVCWITLGLYNCVIKPHDKGRFESIIAWLEAEGIRYETWILRSSLIESFGYSKIEVLAGDWRKELSTLAGNPVHPELLELIREFCPLMATAIGRSELSTPILGKDIASANKIILGELLQLPKEIDHNLLFETQGLLTTINAGLSRLTSQAYSGFSPIISTECHFWSHSLLGTGTANLALANFVAYIRDKIASLRIPQRLENLDNLKMLEKTFPPVQRLRSVAAQDAFWDGGYLGQVNLSAGQLERPVFPVFTYFSGRDGFKSTLTTLSAPLASVSSCNSLRWSLLTITHEISHNVMKGVLAVLLPDPTSEEELNQAFHLINAQPTDWLNELRSYLLNTLVRLHATEVLKIGEGDKRKFDAHNLRASLEKWHHEIEEIMSHVFDYLYFYGNPEKYIRSIWLSWSVIPNISNRVPEYVLRTLCAVLTEHLRREGAEEITREQVSNVLKALRKEGNGGPYVDEAVSLLETRWEDSLLPGLKIRKNFVKIVKAFLFWREAAQEVMSETKIVSGATKRGGYPHRINIISDDKIENPLRFFEEYAVSMSPSFGHSQWVLQNLAHNYVNIQQ